MFLNKGMLGAALVCAMMALVACSGAKEATPTSPAKGADKAPAAAKADEKKAAPGAGADKAAGSKDDSFTMAAPDVQLEVGKEGQASIKVTAAPGFKINEEYPWKATLKPGAKVTVTENVIKKDKWALSKQEATVNIPVSVKEAGDDTLEADLKFSVCNDEQCYMFTKKAVMKVAAK